MICILITIVVMIYLIMGITWMIAQLASMDDSLLEVLYNAISVERFQEGNILGKILIIMRDIVILPFIIATMILALIGIFGSLCMTLIKKICGWDD